jgi:hypothetical protein
MGTTSHHLAMKKMMGLVFAASIVALFMPHSAWAYYSVTPVTIGLSSSSVSVSAGSSLSVSCSVTPQSEAQLPGCGMSTCPQSCGDGCLDANGWCQCAGTTYTTYTTQVSVSSDDPSVARASWSGGVLQITAYTAGTATLTVCATLEKHQDAYQTVTVTVSEAATNTTSSSSSNSSSDDDGTSVSVSVSETGSSVTSTSSESTTKEVTVTSGVSSDAADTSSDTTASSAATSTATTSEAVIDDTTTTDTSAEDTAAVADTSTDTQTSPYLWVAVCAGVLMVAAAAGAIFGLRHHRLAHRAQSGKLQDR